MANFEISITEGSGGMLEAVTAASTCVKALKLIYICVKAKNGIMVKVFKDSKPSDVFEIYHLQTALKFPEGGR